MMTRLCRSFHVRKSSASLGVPKDGSRCEIDSLCEDWTVVNAVQYIKLTFFHGGS
jgi:hypothetical protein